jgi:hypothetical protein
LSVQAANRKKQTRHAIQRVHGHVLHPHKICTV